MKTNKPFAALGALLAFVLGPGTGSHAGEGPVAASGKAARATEGDETVQLSPFEVREDNKGYYAVNSMSGTRLNMKVEDLAASISVVTKQQMADFALLDINDIFDYESNTEGTGNFTAFEVDRNGMVTDDIQNNPQGANRVRGIGPANIAVDNFANSGRAPIDPIAIDAVEISRGPNSNIFGLGEGSGTVNLVAASANFNREATTATVRFDDRGGWRTSLDVNRPLIPGKLGVRASAVYQHDEAPQKPSGFETRRFNLMVRAQPFRTTTLRAAFNSYHGVGTRATAVTPRDAVSWWKAIGAPVWDPITSTATYADGTTLATGTADPPGLAGKSISQPMMIIDGGLRNWMISRMPSANATSGPNNVNGAMRLLETIAEPVRAGRPLFSTVPGISDQLLFNWEKINLAAPNTIKDQVETATVTVEQTVLDSQMNRLAFQFAWQREDADRINRNVIGRASDVSAASYYLYMDVNSRLLNGQPNPNFRRPYLGVGEPTTEENPYVRDSYRAQGAYVLDLARQRNWTRWLGRHQLLGYYEERKTKTYRYRFRDVMISDHPVYARAGQPKGNQSAPASPLATRGYYHFYVGDNQGYNVDHAPSGYSLGEYTFNWFNPRANDGAGEWVADRATFGRSGIDAGTAGGNGRVNLIKTRGGLIHSGIWQDRIVVTYGRREDENRNKHQRPSRLMPNGWEFDYAAMDGWVGDWALRSGETTTTGVVARPFRGWTGLDAVRNHGGVSGFLAQTLAGLQVFYNESNSFRPATPAISIVLNELPNPTSEQKEKGFWLNLWDNRLVLRANWYETVQINSRAGQSAVLATRTGRIDFSPFKGERDAFSLQRQARNWVSAANPEWAPEQIENEVARIMQLPPDYLEAINSNEVTETSDVRGKGQEYELNFNPTSTWTLRLNVTRQMASDANLSPNIPRWLQERLPVWESIIDPRAPNPGPDGTFGTADDSIGYKWFDTRYSGDNPSTSAGGIPRSYLQRNVLAPLRLAQVTEGKARPQTREWRVNLTTRYQLARFENAHLKRMTVGGAVRWESEGAIGYYGIPIDGDITIATDFDGNRPIWDSDHIYLDAFAGYRVRLFSDRIRANFQLNVRNLQESGRLQKVGAYPDGRAHTFRIINPRMFIFTATFDL